MSNFPWDRRSTYGAGQPHIPPRLPRASNAYEHPGAVGALIAADSAHETELADDAAPREDRDEAAEKIRGVLVDRPRG